MAPERLTHPALAPFRSALERLLPISPPDRLAWLNAAAQRSGLKTASARPLRFVPAESAKATADCTSPGLSDLARDPGHRYETGVAASGEVPTRLRPPGDWHDLFNALIWLEFPRSKAALNALHARTIQSDAGEACRRTGSERGRLRDLLTLLDESGVLWVGTDPDLARALRDFDWRALFVDRRERVRDAVRVRIFGHGLLLKCTNPYKALTGHALLLELPADSPIGRIDRALARKIEGFGHTPPDFCPLPVLGVPGWDEDNERPDYYDDPGVFRSGRRRTRNLTMKGDGR